MKNVVFLLVVMLMIFARSISAQTVLTIQGNVSDINGTPIANHDVVATIDTMLGVMAMGTTDVNGDYNIVLQALLSQGGILLVGTEDCNQNMVVNTHTFMPNTVVNSNFIICAPNIVAPCTLSGAYIYSSPNGLTATVTGGTLPYSYSWSNGSTSNWLPYYQGWCVNIVDANGCDTTICDTSSITQPCILSGAYVTASPNGLTAGIMTMPPNSFFYIWNNGTVGNSTPFYQNWCVQIIDTINSCDTIICNSLSNPCSLGGVSVNNTPNGLIVSINGGTPPYTYIWSNGTTGYWSQFYQNWCVAIVDANGCDTTICDSTSSSMTCQAGFQSYIIGFNPNAVPVMVQFNDLSLPQGSISSWLWDFGDGTTNNTQNPVHTYSIPGVYYACLTITANLSNGTVCTSTFCDSVWADTTGINPPPFCSADFTSTQVSGSISTFFTNLSSGTNASTSYFWDFGDGTTSTDENPVHLYATSGWYYVCLTIMDSTTNCYDTYCDYINITIGGGQGCQAYLWSSPGWMPNSYEFFDYSSGNATNWLWDFGDGTTSTQQNPIHTYSPTATGFFLVCLTIEEYDPVTQALICTDTYCDSIYLMNQPSSCQADFYAQDLGNNEAIFTNTSYPQTGATWFGFAEVNIDFGDGTNAFNIGGTINHTYPNDGTYYVCIEVVEYHTGGNILCTDTYCDSVTVTSGTMPCQAAFCAIQDSTVIITQNPNGTTTTTIGDAFFFCDLSTPVNNIQSWQWDMGDNGAGQYLQNTSSTSQMPVYEYDTNGVYYVCLTIVTTGGQCTSITCDSVDFSMMQGQTAINEVNTFEALKLFPNPANDKLTVNLISNTNGNLSIRLVNMMGQTLSYENITIFNGAINHSLDVSEIANGVYSVEVVLDGEKQHQRVVISR
jgi:PKD repeat protein